MFKSFKSCRSILNYLLEEELKHSDFLQANFFSGLLGFIANCLVIPVLCTKKMSNTFNRLLVRKYKCICKKVESIKRAFFDHQIKLNESFSFFNVIQVMLAVFDNVYVMCSMSEAVRNHFVSTDQHLVRRKALMMGKIGFNCPNRT